MPNLSKLWRAKTNSLIAPLVEFTYDVIGSDDEGSHVNLYIAASRIRSSNGAPDKSDISRARIQLWPSDVRVLLREFAHLWQAHLSDEDEHANADEDENGGEANADEDRSNN
jgi:hypothetical protein